MNEYKESRRQSNPKLQGAPKNCALFCGCCEGAVDSIVSVFTLLLLLVSDLC